MGRKATVLSLILCILLLALASRSFSQTRGPRTPAEQQRWIQEQQRKAQQQRFESEAKQKAAQKDARKLLDEYSDQAWQEALGATAEQWKTIKPRLERVRKIASPPAIQVSVYAFGGGGSNTSNSFSNSSGTGGGTGGVSASARAGGFGGAGGSGGGAGGYYSGGASGNAQGGGSVSGSGQGGSSFAGGGAAGGSSGYGYSIGGTGPVKKQVGEVSLGWQWRRPSLNKTAGPLSDNEKTCEQLLDVLETKNPDPEQVRPRVEAVRKIREQIQAERREARQQLREVVTPEQEAKLVLMGYLD